MINDLFKRIAAIQMFHTSISGINQMKSQSIEMNFLKINGISNMTGGQSNNQGQVAKPFDICKMVSLNENKDQNCTKDTYFLQQVFIFISRVNH